MELRLTKFGNSKGVRLPKSVLEQAGLKDRMRVVIEDRNIILTPIESPREGWEEAASQIAAAGEDALLMPDVFEDEDIDAMIDNTPS